MENHFFSRNYHLNKLFLLHVGVWPEQTLTTRIVVPSLLIFSEFVLLILECVYLWSNIVMNLWMYTPTLCNISPSRLQYCVKVAYSSTGGGSRNSELIRVDFWYHGYILLPEVEEIEKLMKKRYRGNILVRITDVWGDFDQIVEPLPSVLLITTSTAILINTGMKRSSIIELIKRIEYSWKLVAKTPPLTAILERYATEGRQFTIQHAVFLWGATMAFIGLPLTPLVLNIVVPLNESRPKKFLFSAEYGIDEEKYYYWILFHSYIAVYSCIGIFVVIDTILSIWVQHCCALFEITGYYLKHITDKADFNLSTDIAKRSPQELTYSNLCYCIKQHQDAMVFANIIESMYSMINAYMTAMSMLLISITGVVIATQLSNIDEALRYIAMILGLMYQLYHYSFFGQKLIDHSARVSEYAYNCDWSTLSPKEQKLLLLIIAQSQRPCFLTAGKLFVINMENFSSVVKTSVSYFTMLSSLR